MKKIFDLINRNFLRPVPRFSPNIRMPKELPIITISREKGSGGRFVALQIAKEMGKPWVVFNKEIADVIAHETHLEKGLIQEVDEGNIPFIEEIIDEIFGEHYLNLPGYYKHLVKVLSTIGSRGYVIIVGRGANFLFPHALNIRVICQMEQRIKWMMEYENLTRDQAKKAIDESDKKRVNFGKSLYHHDIRKAHHYDLVIKTSEDLSVDNAAELIVSLAKKRFIL